MTISGFVNRVTDGEGTVLGWFVQATDDEGRPRQEEYLITRDGVESAEEAKALFERAYAPAFVTLDIWN